MWAFDKMKMLRAIITLKEKQNSNSEEESKRIVLDTMNGFIERSRDLMQDQIQEFSDKLEELHKKLDKSSEEYYKLEVL